jgi:DNA-binding IscR family transcriptional regulator
MLTPASATKAIGEVVELFEGKKDSTGCVFELRRCSAKHPCPLHEPWQRVQEQYQRMLDSVEISDLGREVTG